MDRLGTLDAEFLHMEDGRAPLHIGGVGVFEGPPPSLEAFTEALSAKLHRIPRYRQRVRTVPFELGRPVWVDDPHFDVRYHVRHTALPAPGDDRELTRLVSRLMSQALDRHRPLWEIWLVEGLRDGRWGLVFKVHHCMVDGVAGVGLLTAVLDVAADAPLPDPPPWDPAPEPSGVALVADAWAGLAGDLARNAADLGRLALRPGELVASAGRLVDGIVGFGRDLTPLPASTLEGPIGPHRAWAHSSASLAEVREVRQAFGGTVNDVVLTVVASGLRDLLRHHGEVPEEAAVRTAVPVSTRGDDGRGVADNRVSVHLVELPVDEADPVRRLARVREVMAEHKASNVVAATSVVTDVADLAPPMLVGAASRLVLRALHRLPQRSIATVTTNVPGPQLPLYCHGRLLVGYLPYVPVMDGVRVGTAILSYDGRLYFGVTGDLDAAPDVDILAQGIVRGLEELVAAARAADVP